MSLPPLKISHRPIKISLFIYLILALNSCIPTYIWLATRSEINYEKDQIKNIDRYRTSFYYYFDEETNTSFKKTKQLIIKENDQFKSRYIFYDYIYLDIRVSKIDSPIYFIVDNKFHQIQILEQEHQIYTRYDEEDAIDRSLVKVKYEIDEETLMNIFDAKSVKIRYYAEPEIMTLSLSKQKISILQELLLSKFENRSYKPAFK